MSIKFTLKLNIPVNIPNHTHIHSFISCNPFTILWYFGQKFLKYETSIKIIKILVLEFYLKDIYSIQMYTLVTLAHMCLLKRAQKCKIVFYPTWVS